MSYTWDRIKPGQYRATSPFGTTYTLTRVVIVGKERIGFSLSSDLEETVKIKVPDRISWLKTDDSGYGSSKPPAVGQRIDSATRPSKTLWEFFPSLKTAKKTMDRRAMKQQRRLNARKAVVKTKGKGKSSTDRAMRSKERVQSQSQLDKAFKRR